MVDPTSVVTIALEMASSYLRGISHDKQVEAAYDDLINRLGWLDETSPSFQSQLERYQVEKDELIRLLKRHQATDRDTEILEAAQKLLSAVEEAVETRYADNLERMWNG